MVYEICRICATSLNKVSTKMNKFSPLLSDSKFMSVSFDSII